MMELIWWMNKRKESENMPRFLAWVTEDKEGKVGDRECWGIGQ